MNYDRRTAITTAAAMLVGATSLGAATRAKRPFFGKGGPEIGLQIYTLGTDPTTDLDGTFAKVAAIGYRDLELPNLLGKTPAVLKAAADRAGLRFSSIHLGSGVMAGSGLSLDSEPQAISDALGVLGIHSAVLPIVPIPASFVRSADGDFRKALTRSLVEAGSDHWKKLADTLNHRAHALKPFGIALGYHNHNVEFVDAGKGTGWDVLQAETDPTMVHFEVDLGWVSAAGLDPVEFLHRTKGRVRWIHVKDLKASTAANTALQMDPTEVGSGRMDWKSILPAAKAAGVQHFYVEQEPPFTMPRIDAAAKSFAYLAALKV